jgi:hypothetical protein
MRHSPFLFLKRLVFIQIFFALLPFMAALLISLFVGDLNVVYENLALARSISFEFFLTIISTTLQLLVLFFAFVTWYFPVYHANREQITHDRGSFLGMTQLVNTAAIISMSVRQGWLAQRVGYGSIEIETSDAAGKAIIKDIADPYRHMNLIWDLVQPGVEQDEAFLSFGSPQELLRTGEGHNVEYKSSLMWDYRQQRVNKELYLPVMKSTAAFMNTSGGFLVIGVDDDGNVLGLEPDLNSMRRGNTDGFESTFSNAFNKMIGVEFRQFVELVFPNVDEQTICLVRVLPAEFPAFLVHKGEENFYIRAGNASQPLSLSQTARYISRRFDSIST